VNAGILGIGVHLPAAERHNDWWPAATVEKWRDKARRAAAALPPPVMNDAIRFSLAKAKPYEDDPFNGIHSRRVMPAGSFSSEMETAAAQEALADAGIRASDVDALLVFSFCPDYLNVQNGPAIQKRLGLPERCLTLGIEGACNSFLLQMTLAQQLVAGGAAKNVLLVQSASFSAIIAPDSPMSPWFGDGATAAVVGPVAPGRGILSAVHRADGSRQRAVVTGVPGKRWYEPGRLTGYAEDPVLSRDLILGSAERAMQVIPEALREAGASAGDVGFYACHQGTPWLRVATQEYCGLTSARSLDTFPMFGSMTACNIPLVLSVARRERSLGEDDLVVMFAGGTGETWSSIVLRWGGR
jgi:3-oxoacyl-[acyl-carrier-protein] synthase-3